MKTSKDRKQVITAVPFPAKYHEHTSCAIIQWGEDAQHSQVGEFRYSLDTDSGDRNCYRIVFDSEMEYGFEGLTKEHVNVLMDGITLRPISLTCRFESMDHVIELTGEYKSKKVVVRYNEDGVKDKWVEKVPFQVLDNYQSLIVLRALDFSGLGTDYFSLINPLTLSLAEVECSCIDREPIITPIGEFECYRICLQVYDPVPFTQYNFYSVEAPHHLIKVVKGPLVFEVRSIV